MCNGKYIDSVDSNICNSQPYLVAHRSCRYNFRFRGSGAHLEDFEVSPLQAADEGRHGGSVCVDWFSLDQLILQGREAEWIEYAVTIDE